MSKNLNDMFRIFIHKFKSMSEGDINQVLPTIKKLIEASDIQELKDLIKDKNDEKLIDGFKKIQESIDGENLAQVLPTIRGHIEASGIQELKDLIQGKNDKELIDGFKKIQESIDGESLAQVLSTISEHIETSDIQELIDGDASNFLKTEDAKKLYGCIKSHAPSVLTILLEYKKSPESYILILKILKGLLVTIVGYLLLSPIINILFFGVIPKVFGYHLGAEIVGWCFFVLFVLCVRCTVKLCKPRTSYKVTLVFSIIAVMAGNLCLGVFPRALGRHLGFDIAGWATLGLSALAMVLLIARYWRPINLSHDVLSVSKYIAVKLKPVIENEVVSKCFDQLARTISQPGRAHK